MDQVHSLHLYLPAKWETTDKFLDNGVKGYKSNPGGFLNKKHEEFSAVIDRNSLAQIGLAKTNGAIVFDSYADPTYRYTAIASLSDHLLVLGTTPEPPATVNDQGLKHRRTGRNSATLMRAPYGSAILSNSGRNAPRDFMALRFAVMTGQQALECQLDWAAGARNSAAPNR